MAAEKPLYGDASEKKQTHTKDFAENEPVEDTDPSSLSSQMNEKYPVQDTALPKDNGSLAVETTLEAASVAIRALSPDSERIKQPEENESTRNTEEPQSGLMSKCQSSRTASSENCTCSVNCFSSPTISDLLNDEDLLYILRIKLDPCHPTVKNWRNFASKWGMTYDELCFIEQKQKSPTLEFLFRNSERTVEQLIDLCKLYNRADVQTLLLKWVKYDWPKKVRRNYPNCL
ncbi:ectodysplasin-A receptor-associated adapter protein isoform X4 [Pleurodeles waltl]|uniref:ectodysplasin-A receptor-associated adapter protein isoform X4 n=1 Tax=Pleurodeles waltl TaxID=8319 RepID=UPI0037095846